MPTPSQNPVSETLADLAAGQYTAPSRADPSSWWRDSMVRRSPSFQDPGPMPPRPPSTIGDPPINAPITTTTGANTTNTGQQINPSFGVNSIQWSTPDAVGPGFGAALQQLGIMPANLVYNPETRTWA